MAARDGWYTAQSTEGEGDAVTDDRMTSEHDPYGLHRHDEQGREIESCDDPRCRALQEPETIEEVRAAMEHWRDHSHLSGCSHGR